MRWRKRYICIRVVTRSREMFTPPMCKNSSSIFCGNEIGGVFTVKIYFIIHTNTAELNSVPGNALPEAFLYAWVSLAMWFCFFVTKACLWAVTGHKTHWRMFFGETEVKFPEPFSMYTCPLVVCICTVTVWKAKTRLFLSNNPSGSPPF